MDFYIFFASVLGFKLERTLANLSGCVCRNASGRQVGRQEGRAESKWAGVQEGCKVNKSKLLSTFDNINVFCVSLKFRDQNSKL